MIWRLPVSFPDRDWVVFTRRTEHPKLQWIIDRLAEVGIEIQHQGFSAHGPITYVRVAQEAAAKAFLTESVVDAQSRSRVIDDIPDDDPLFSDRLSIFQADGEDPDDFDLDY